MLTMQQRVFVGVVLLFAFVLAESKPTFRVSYESVTVDEGRRVELTCSAEGDAPITYEWYLYDDKIYEDRNASVFVVDNGTESFLVIRSAEASHEGMYTCTASNQHGMSSKVYQITVVSSTRNETNGTGGFIVNIEVENVATNSVRFHISVSGSPDFIEVRYKESRETRTLTKRWEYGDDYEVKDLIPGGKYKFQFQTPPLNDQNVWEYEVILLPVAPEILLQKLEGRTIKLGWFVKTDDIMRGTIDSYELKYFSVQMNRGNEWKASDCVKTVRIPSCTGASYTISDLSLRSYYEIQLRAHTASGYGEFSTQKVFLT